MSTLTEFQSIERIERIPESNEYEVVFREEVDYLYGGLVNALKEEGYHVMSAGKMGSLIEGVEDDRLQVRLAENPEKHEFRYDIDEWKEYQDTPPGAKD